MSQSSVIKIHLLIKYHFIAVKFNYFFTVTIKFWQVLPVYIFIYFCGGMNGPLEFSTISVLSLCTNINIFISMVCSPQLMKQYWYIIFHWSPCFIQSSEIFIPFHCPVPGSYLGYTFHFVVMCPKAFLGCDSFLQIFFDFDGSDSFEKF